MMKEQIKKGFYEFDPTGNFTENAVMNEEMKEINKNSRNEKKLKWRFLTNILVSTALVVVVFALFGTMLIDMLLVKSEVSPVFSRFNAVSYNNDEYIEGHGILYSTIETRMDDAGGYLAGYKFYLGYKKFESSENLALNIKYHTISGKVISLNNVKEELNEVENFETDTLNMEAVKSLADGAISAIDFMKKYPGTVSEGNANVYNLALPNNYALQIEYSGENINYMYFFDTQLGQYIDLNTQHIDMFLLERNELKN